MGLGNVRVPAAEDVQGDRTGRCQHGQPNEGRVGQQGGITVFADGPNYFKKCAPLQIKRDNKNGESSIAAIVTMPMVLAVLPMGVTTGGTL